MNGAARRPLSRKALKYHGIEWWSAPSGLQSARVEA